MNSWEICNALTFYGRPFDRRRFLCCPNVSHGWGLNYEADLIAVTPAGFAYEIEIKISASDLRADRKKSKWTRGLDPRIKRFYYAVPRELVPVAMETEARFGVVEIYHPRWSDGEFPTAVPNGNIVRKAKDIPGHREVSAREVNELRRLLSLRYWDLRMKGKESAPSSESR